MYTPEASFVRDLTAYDSRLRARWARHTAQWFVERKMDRLNPSLVAERPTADGSEPLEGLRADLWEGWRQGYLHVLTVPHGRLHWSVVADALAGADSWRKGSFEALNRELDEADEARDRAADRNIDSWSQNATDDAYEHMAWFTGRRVAMTNPDPEPALVDTGLGFKMRDRRRG